MTKGGAHPHYFLRNNKKNGCLEKGNRFYFA